MDLHAEDAFKALGHPLRVKIVDMLASGEKCVCELFEVLNVSQPSVSQHLNVMKAAGVVKCQKRGANVYYRLVSSGFTEMVRLCREAIGEPPPAPYLPLEDACDPDTNKLRTF
ncbi:MAG: metalloregulator ArsR/SmtB family transcription factor [Bacillota bacterium]|nr:metalloregulator ArsR/SmtB family transcription factor [Bacillota bacterium]